jgi:gentisate 1,2-dioxygenase
MRAWAGHQGQAEPVETSQLIDLMFSQVGEGLDLLAALDGQYEIKGGVIVFKNPASGTRYTSIRSWVDQRMQAWAGTPESARPYSVSAILRALGEGLPASQ